jgi:type IV secretory pathway ATPase VirB11/archaellum biosynthesis ATPase
MTRILDDRACGDILAYNDFPVSGSGFSEDAQKRPDCVERSSQTPTVSDSLTRIGRRCVRRKPAYADTWAVGDISGMEVIESYDLPDGKVVVVRTEDGEIEYNVMPDEYSYHGDIGDSVSAAIDHVRDIYRKKGGSMDRQTVMSLAGAFLRKRFEKAEEDVSGVLVSDICETVYRHTLGLGIFDVLLRDSRIEDIFIDAPCENNRIHITLNQVSGLNAHVRCRTNLVAEPKEIRNLINVLKRESGLLYCETNPILETDMDGGSARATVVGYPLSPNGDSVAIRKHSRMPWTTTRLIANGSIDPYTAGLLSFLVENRSTFLICGARGSGKSSLLSAMLFEFPVSQRILTIEDTMELPGERMRSMGYKVQSMLIDDRMEGDARKRADEALRVSLRLGESAIALGEVRGDEARTLYQSMRTGRAGSSILGTIHGDSARSVYDRVVHDMGILPEAFMATDFLVTMGSFRGRGEERQIRRLSEAVATGAKPGEFVDLSSPGGLTSSGAIRRIMSEIGITEAEMIEEISVRAAMREFLSEMSKRHGEGFLGPEWIVMANDFLAKHLSSGVTSYDEIMGAFRLRFSRFGGEE